MERATNNKQTTSKQQTNNKQTTETPLPPPLYCLLLLVTFQEAQAELEFQQEKERRTLDMEISRLRSELAHLTRQNTSILADLTDLKRDKSELEKQLDAGKGLLHSSSVEEKMAETREEVRRLRELAGMQQQQISHMHSELQQLVRKDGHVAPPAKQGPAATSTSLPPL